MTNKHLYFHKHNDNMYWGTYFNGMPVFRTKPIVTGRWYVSGNIRFAVWCLTDRYVANIKYKEKDDITKDILIGLNGEGLEHIDCAIMRYTNLENDNADQKERYFNWFRRRLRRFRGKYFIPQHGMALA